MVLSKIVSKIEYTTSGHAELLQADITSVCYDSRKAVWGGLFVCLTGALADGHNFARDAYDRGCRAFLCERQLELPGDAVQLITGDTRAALALASAEFFSRPAEDLTIIGVTGTAGKTTAALLIQHILLSSGVNAGYIGSNGVAYGDQSYHTENTTPESYELHRYFDAMRRNGVSVVVLEVSSQALFLKRVHGIPFKVCVFTNLGLDHVDAHEHPTFEHYRDCKASLFRDYGCEYMVYNADDAHCAYMLEKSTAGTAVGYGMTGGSDFCADSMEMNGVNGFYGTSFRMKAPSGCFSVRMRLPGRYNVYNAMAAMAACSCLGIEVSGMTRALETASVRGRFEQVNILPGCTFIIDYAHNGVSLRSVLETIRQYEPKQVVCLFGSVGGRTQSRRLELGKAAAELADVCVLTADNPNFEPPEDVIADIAESFEGSACRVLAIPDRTEAIEYAVRNARPGDAVLLAGKGHEDYQLIRGKRIPFDERQILTAAAEKYLQLEV